MLQRIPLPTEGNNAMAFLMTRLHPELRYQMSIKVTKRYVFTNFSSVLALLLPEQSYENDQCNGWQA